MKKQIITLTVAALTLSSCGIYTQYKPATEVPDNLYGEGWQLLIPWIISAI